MNKHPRRIVVIFLALVCAVFFAVGMVFPNIAASKLTYIDISSGCFRREWRSCGRIYKTTFEETRYSQLLKNNGLEELPSKWKLAYKTELGIRRLFYAQNINYPYGRVAADAIEFSMLLEMANLSEKELRQNILEFRALVQDGTPTEVRNYLESLKAHKMSRVLEKGHD